jgi:acyl-CoA thioesterase I
MTLTSGKRQSVEFTGPRRRARRRLLTLAITCAAGLLAACGGANGSVDGDATGTNAPRWLVLGSSTAAGVGASAGVSWAARLDTALRARGARLDNRARSGAVTYSALPATAPRPAGRPASDPAQDVEASLQTAAHAVILAFPSNDAVNGYTADETAANLLLVREVARRHGAAVIVLSSQPRDGTGASARAAMRAVDAALGAELGPCFVAVHAALADANDGIDQRYGAGDGIHLNNAGHTLVFERLWAAVTAGQCVTPP